MTDNRQVRVLVSGTGKMGRAILAALDAERDVEPVAAVDAFAPGSVLALDSGTAIAVYTDAASAIAATTPDVAIDFTNAAWTPVLADAAIERGVRLVIGTSGLSDAFAEDLARRCRERRLGAVVAANFAIGAVLMMHMAKLAAPYFEAAEIIEMHHDQKVDAPSGTSIATARGMAQARRGAPFSRNEPTMQTITGTRAGAVDGVTVHSVRLPGLVAHQEVVFGGIGQTLSIRHDSLGRESFMPGILLAVREVMRREELVVGLGALIGLE